MGAEGSKPVVVQEKNPTAPPAESWSCLDVEVVKLRHTWTIRNFRACLEFGGLESPTFGTESCPGVRWSVEVCPRYTDQNDKQWVSLHLHLAESNQSVVEAEFKFTLLDDEHEEIGEPSSHLPTAFLQGESWGSGEFVELRDVLDRLEEQSSDALSVRCEVTATVFRETPIL